MLCYPRHFFYHYTDKIYIYLKLYTVQCSSLALCRLIKQLKSWKDSIFSKATWQKWFKDAQSYIVSYKDSAVEKARQYATTSPAHAYEEGAEATLEEAVKKILKERDPTGNFGGKLQ